MATVQRLQAELEAQRAAVDAAHQERKALLHYAQTLEADVARVCGGDRPLGFKPCNRPTQPTASCELCRCGWPQMREGSCGKARMSSARSW